MKRRRRAQSGALWESLESRQLLSVSAQQPIARPLDVAMPLDGTLANGTSGPAAITPSQFRSIYGIDKIKINGITGDGTGQTIAIIIANDAPNFVSSSNPNFARSDLHIFDQQFGLPDPPSFTKIEQNMNGSNPPADTGWAEEASLDVEWTHAIAPGAKILLLEAFGAGSVQLLDWGAQTAASYGGVSVVSMSFGFSEFYGENGYDNDFTTPPGHNGVTFVAATGDTGSQADYPAYSPNVVAGGGTHLSHSGGSYSSESGYSSGGGGISAYERKPSFQSGVHKSSSERTVPDVSIDGDPNTGVDVYDSFNGGYANKWYEIAGTSLSSPSWSALIAIANQERATAGMSSLNGPTQTLPKLYSINGSDFHDITSGNNGFSAGAGFDLVTGRGSPIANVLVPDLAGVSASVGGGGGGATPGSISGEIYTDTNGNGKIDNGESGLSGARVYLDINNDGSFDSGDAPYTVGLAGTFTFRNLPAGTYHLREVIPGGYKLTNPTSDLYTVSVQSGAKVSGIDFGNSRTTATPGSISGYVYLDKNNDRHYDTGDSALSGVKVYLDSNNDGKLDNGEYATTTNSTGYYHFGSLPPGTYRFAELLPSGYHLTNPTTGYYMVTVQAGMAVMNENWGNLK